MNIWLWSIFAAIVLGMIALDLLVLTRRPRAVTPGEARATLALWVLTAAGFSMLLWHTYQSNFLALEELLSAPLDKRNLDGHSAWLQFVTCYVMELALNLDNIAVLALLMRYFKVPAPILPRALFWSIMFGLLTRLVMIQGAAYALLHHPTTKWALGAILVVAFIRVLVMPDQSRAFDVAWYVRAAKRLLPFSSSFDGQRLFARGVGRKIALTPLALAVLVAAVLDLSAAGETVPALFSVTQDPLIAFSASTLAMLALRSGYFAIAGIINRFRFLKLSLVVILVYVAVVTFLEGFKDVPTVFTLALVGGVMLLGVGASVLVARKLPAPAGDGPVSEFVEEPDVPSPLEDISAAATIARKNLRKIWILIAGTAVIVFGIAIAPLPGPGPMVLVPLGLALLATEFIWAKRLLDKAKSGAFNVSDRADAVADRIGRWVLPIVAVGFWALGLTIVFGGARAINHIAGSMGYEHVQLAPKWYHILIMVGSPFFPVAAWMVSYLRRFRGKGLPTPKAGSDEAKADAAARKAERASKR